MSDLVVLERPTETIAWLTLNRPEKKNALSVELRDQGTEVLAALADDDALRCLVVTGAGDTFSAGFDLKEFDAAAGDPAIWNALWESSDRWHQAWIGFPLPTVAAVNGPALAGGFDVAVMCDLRVVAETAWFAHPEIGFGDVVYGPLHDLIGGSRARDLALTGRRMDASEAFALGVANRLVPAERVVDEARAVAEAVAAAPRDVLMRMKAKIQRRAGVLSGATLEL